MAVRCGFGSDNEAHSGTAPSGYDLSPRPDPLRLPSPRPITKDGCKKTQPFPKQLLVAADSNGLTYSLV